MGKQSNRAYKKAENFGKGNVTPTQVAFLVDRYLSDNNFSETRSLFRTEASSLLSKSSSQEVSEIPQHVRLIWSFAILFGD